MCAGSKDISAVYNSWQAVSHMSRARWGYYCWGMMFSFSLTLWSLHQIAHSNFSYSSISRRCCACWSKPLPVLFLFAHNCYSIFLLDLGLNDLLSFVFIFHSSNSLQWQVSSFSTTGPKFRLDLSNGISPPIDCDEKDYVRWKNCLRRDLTINGLVLEDTNYNFLVIEIWISSLQLFTFFKMFWHICFYSFFFSCI
jgi:hypothetical protein